MVTKRPGKESIKRDKPINQPKRIKFDVLYPMSTRRSREEGINPIRGGSSKWDLYDQIVHAETHLQLIELTADPQPQLNQFTAKACFQSALNELNLMSYI